ncbi:MAG: hypothetical protein AAFR81_08945 [Chloroflexota bacterium]
MDFMKSARFVLLWGLLLTLATWGLPTLAATLTVTFGLPFILNNMLAAFIVGSLLGQTQFWMLRRLPDAFNERWLSQTTLSAVISAFAIGFFSIFFTDLSSLSNVPIQIPIGFVLVGIAIQQAVILRRTQHLPTNTAAFSWVWMYSLLAIISGMGIWWALPAVLPLTGVLLIANQQAKFTEQEKAKREDSHADVDAITYERLTDGESAEDDELAIDATSDADRLSHVQ